MTVVLMVSCNLIFRNCISFVKTEIIMAKYDNRRSNAQNYIFIFAFKNRI